MTYNYLRCFTFGSSFYIMDETDVLEGGMDMLREYRRMEVHGNAYWRPEKYHLLVDEQIQEPFIRNDYRK